MSKEALVVDRKKLFKDGDFHGFLPSTERNLIGLILKSHYYHARGNELENNQELQQIIPYVWIINPKEKKVLAYRRSSTQSYNEKRLRNKWSCGVGGHIDKEDSSDPITNAMMRELKEEVLMSVYPKPKIIGYLNDDKDDVGKVHFGVVALAETEEKVEKGSDEMAECRFLSIKEIESLFSNPANEIESWTTLSWPFVKNYLIVNQLSSSVNFGWLTI
ncbi:NUDIX domain-containing protein [Candidatus Pacearchaeota archaeon]|nr:NUDIX domain-containing protein [Candidatus Pacearchaeota archaeon]